MRTIGSVSAKFSCINSSKMRDLKASTCASFRGRSRVRIFRRCSLPGSSELRALTINGQDARWPHRRDGCATNSTLHFWRVGCLTREHENNIVRDAVQRRADVSPSCQPTGPDNLQPKVRGGTRQCSARFEAGCEQYSLHGNNRASRTRLGSFARRERQNEPADPGAELSERSGLAGVVTFAV